MSIIVLLLSVLFALIEAALSYAVLAYEPVTSALSGIPSFVLVGGIFAVGMLLTFLLIILIGFMNVRCHAGDFVLNYFGKTIALALIFSIILGALSLGSEALYQIRPDDESEEKAGFERVINHPEVMDSLLTPRRTYSYVPIKSELEHNVQEAGGNIDAPLRFSIQWSEPEFTPDDRNDLDAHAICGNELIYYSSKLGFTSGGALDVDIIHPNEQPTKAAIENIMYPDLDRIKGKTFEFLVHCFTYRNGTSGFRAEVEIGDMIYSYDYQQPLTSGQKIKVADVTVDLDGNMSIVHHLNYYNFVDLSYEEAAVEKETSRFNFLSLINSAVMRCILIFIIAFLYRLISSICIGKNDRSFLFYIIVSFITAILASLLLEFGYRFELPIWAVLTAFWLLLTTLIVSAD